MDARDFNGNTALHMTVWWKMCEMYDFIETAGKDKVMWFTYIYFAVLMLSFRAWSQSTLVAKRFHLLRITVSKYRPKGLRVPQPAVALTALEFCVGYGRSVAGPQLYNEC